MTRCAQATAHPVRARQWMVARFSLERRLERVVERYSKLYSWEGERVIEKERSLSLLSCLTLEK